VSPTIVADESLADNVKCEMSGGPRAAKEILCDTSKWLNEAKFWRPIFQSDLSLHFNYGRALSLRVVSFAARGIMST
jgi:hypothetical protein